MAVQVGAVQQGVRYTDELPKLHKEIKHDVHWIGSIHAQADRVVKVCVRLTDIVRASKGCGPQLVSHLSYTPLLDALEPCPLLPVSQSHRLVFRSTVCWQATTRKEVTGTPIYNPCIALG